MIKRLFGVLFIGILVIGLTGCTGKKEKNNNESNDKNTKSITLSIKSDTNKKEYNIKFDSNSNNNDMHFDSDYPTTAQIRNEKDNYIIDIQINEMSKMEYEYTIAEEKKNSSFKEEKIGNFEGYSYNDKNTGTTTVKALIDGSNPDARIYATMIVWLNDDSNANGLTSEKLYKSSKVQYIINSITSAEKEI